MDEGCSTIITPPWSAGIRIKDDWESESETTVVGMAVISAPLCVAPLLGIDREICLAVDEFSLVSDAAHGTAVSCRLLLSGG